MVLHYIILHLENSEVYMFRDPVLGNIFLCKYIVYNLLYVCGHKMSCAFIGGNLFIFKIIVNKTSLENGWPGYKSEWKSTE